MAASFAYDLPYVILDDDLDESLVDKDFAAYAECFYTKHVEETNASSAHSFFDPRD